MLLTFLILAITLALFVIGRWRADLVALGSLLALALTGVLSPDQALAGFGDGVTVLVAALFVVGEGLSRTGVSAWVGRKLMAKAAGSATRLLTVVMIGTASLSAVLSNTGTVAMLMPAIVAASWRIGSTPARFLIPMAFAANLGGLLTLIGTPTNIIAANALRSTGQEPFGFFEFAWIGLPLLIGAVVITRYTSRWLPESSALDRPPDLDQAMAEMSDSHRLAGSLFWLRVRQGSPLANRSLGEAGLGRDYGVTVLAIHRAGSGGRARWPTPHLVEQLQQPGAALPGAETTVQQQDLLLVQGQDQEVTRLAIEAKLGVQSADEAQAGLPELLLSQEIGVAEAILTPRSDYAGRTVTEARLAENLGLHVLNVRRGAQIVPRRSTALRPGDTLLVRGRWASIERLQADQRNFVVVGTPEALARQVLEPGPRAAMAVTILAAMVLLLVSGWVPAVLAALLAAVLMVMTGCATSTGAYRSINWETVILIAAMLPMSTALAVTGGADWVANVLVGAVGSAGPLAILAAVFLLTAGLSQIMSNTATTVLVAPIILGSGRQLGLAPEPLMMTVAVAAAAAFLTPIASPTNALVFTTGGYSWGDYLRLGLPLLLLALALCLLVVPAIWPL